MNVVYFLLPLALLLGASFLGSFILSSRRGQFDDLETPAHRILLDDERLISNNDELLKGNLQ